MPPSERTKLFWVTMFGIAFGYVEAAVVVYLRSLYYPTGFSFPLKAMPSGHVAVELGREFATLVMLVATGWIAGKRRWSRFSYFMIAFAVWDIFYYVWLKVMLGWPSTLLDWDILFLIPIPWIGPVIAPCLISVLMIVAGILIIRKEETSVFHPSPLAWSLGIAGSVLMLYTFMRDTNATVGLRLPQPYHYELLGLGLLLCIVGLAFSLKETSGALRTERSSQ